MKESSWLSSLMYWSALAAAAGLMVLVVGAPLFERGEAASTGWQRILALFAGDVVLRRVTLASAVGLVVTARIFFRPQSAPAQDVSREPTSSGGVGA